MKRIVLVTGGFDPLHSGHIEYFKSAKELGDELHVGLNSDEWLTRKKGKPFMPFLERATVIENLAMVDKVVAFDDSDDSACGAIYKTMATHGTIKIIFANGGDRTDTTTPEYKTYGELPNIEFACGVGGNDKKNSSSWILKEWSQPTTERAWGRYTILDKGAGWQVKQLEFDASKALSDQRHSKRSEHWHVVEGEIKMELEFANEYTTTRTYSTGESIDIPKNTWHKATNVGNTTARVIEVWLGKELTEEDIERRD
jgi:cytidyltransferase-like protein